MVVMKPPNDRFGVPRHRRRPHVAQEHQGALTHLLTLVVELRIGFAVETIARLRLEHADRKQYVPAHDSVRVIHIVDHGVYVQRERRRLKLT